MSTSSESKLEMEDQSNSTNMISNLDILTGAARIEQCIGKISKHELISNLESESESSESESAESESEDTIDEEIHHWFSMLSHKFETFELHGLIYGHDDPKNFLDIVFDLEKIIKKIKKVYDLE
jgi:hypothetical protein